MAENITLGNVTTFQNDTTAVNIINGNNAAITTAFTDVLSRSGTSPNQMTSTLDMNSNQIINLPPPSSVNSPARLIDVVSNPTLLVPPTGTSGHTVPFLDGNNTWSGTNTYTNTVTLPSNVVTRANLTQGIARSVIGVTGNATANVADIQGTTRQVLAINTAGTAATFAQPQGDQLLGTTTNDNASAGNVGEYISSTLTTPAGLTTNTPINVTQITLQAGDWDVWSSVGFGVGASTSVTTLINSISTTSATLNGTIGFLTAFSTAPNVVGGTNNLNVGPVRFSLSTATPIFLVVQGTFTVSTLSVVGTIQARRVR